MRVPLLLTWKDSVAAARGVAATRDRRMGAAAARMVNMMSRGGGRGKGIKMQKGSGQLKRLSVVRPPGLRNRSRLQKMPSSLSTAALRNECVQNTSKTTRMAVERSHCICTSPAEVLLMCAQSCTPLKYRFVVATAFFGASSLLSRRPGSPGLGAIGVTRGAGLEKCQLQPAAILVTSMGIS